jgi:hypothetical protein
MSFYIPWTSGMVAVKTDRVIDPNAFEIRARLNRAMAKMARDGINFTQELIDEAEVRIRAEVEAA